MPWIEFFHIPECFSFNRYHREDNVMVDIQLFFFVVSIFLLSFIDSAVKGQYFLSTL